MAYPQIRMNYKSRVMKLKLKKKVLTVIEKIMIICKRLENYLFKYDME